MFRSLGRLLATEMGVLFAEGRNSEAVECLCDALMFGYRIQAGTFLSGVVGLYVDDVALREFGDHLDQLSPQDCDRLIHVVEDRLQLPDPEIAVLSAERDMYLRTLKNHRSDAYALLVQIDPGPNATIENHRAYDAVTQWVKANPDAGSLLFDQAAVLVRGHFDQTLAVIRRPAWERTYPEPAERNSPAARLVFSLVPPSFARMSDRYTRERALIQIVAVYAAIRRFRLQNNALPGSLEALRLGRLALDPFTGTSLGYKRLNGQTFEIASAGPFDRGAAQRPPTGQRVAITLSRSHPTPP